MRHPVSTLRCCEDESSSAARAGILAHAIVPRWAAPANVGSLSTTRHGGTSRGTWGLAGGGPGGLNLGANCGDDPGAVMRNRQRLARAVGSMPVWLDQVHGTDVHRIAAAGDGEAQAGAPRADASVTDVPGVVLAVLTADCLPVLLCDAHGRVVAAAHAGWRGLAAGVLERTVTAVRGLSGPDTAVFAWLGPSIGARSFEVGNDVRERFCDVDARAAHAFVDGIRPGRWFADLHLLARQRLGAAGVRNVESVPRCTMREADDFYSYRRDGPSGRMATLVWLRSR